MFNSASAGAGGGDDFPALTHDDRLPRGYMQRTGTVRREIAQEAYEQAKAFFEDKFRDDRFALGIIVNDANGIEDVAAVVGEAAQRYRNERTGWKAKVMRCCEVVSERILYYGNIMDVIIQHHPEYVSLVWGAMKFVLIGVIQHADLMEKFTQALVEIAEALPKAYQLGCLYQTDAMSDAVSNLYKNILLFFRDATVWYTSHPARRALGSIVKPWDLSYRPVLDQIRRCVQVIDGVADTGEKAEIRDISLRIMEMQRRLDNFVPVVLQYLRGILEVANFTKSITQEIHQTTHDTRKRVLDIQFSTVMNILKPRQRPEDVLRRHYTMAKRTPVLGQNSLDPGMERLIRGIDGWMLSPRSGLLVLDSGFRASHRTMEITVEFIQLLHGNKARILQPGTDGEDVMKRVSGEAPRVAWHLSSQESEGERASVEEDEEGLVGGVDRMEEDEEGGYTTTSRQATESNPNPKPRKAFTPTASDVLKSLIWQCLRIDAAALSGRLDQFSGAQMHQHHGEGEWLELLVQILAQLGGSPPCYVVVEARDLVERPRGEANDDGNDGWEEFMELFRRLVRRSREIEKETGKPCVVKILLVSFGAGEEDLRRWAGEDGKGGDGDGETVVLSVKEVTPVPPRFRRTLAAQNAFQSPKWTALRGRISK